MVQSSFLVSLSALRSAGGWNSAFGDHETELLDVALRVKSSEYALAIGVESSAVFAHDGEGEGEGEGKGEGDAAAIVAGLRDVPRLSAMQALGQAHSLRTLVTRDGESLNLGCTSKTPRCAIDYAARTRTLPPCCKQKIKTMLHAVSGLLTTHKIAHWLDFSSLLGAVRHGGDIVPWDVDADLSLMQVRDPPARPPARVPLRSLCPCSCLRTLVASLDAQRERARVSVDRLVLIFLWVCYNAQLHALSP